MYLAIHTYIHIWPGTSSYWLLHVRLYKYIKCTHTIKRMYIQKTICNYYNVHRQQRKLIPIQIIIVQVRMYDRKLLY